MTIVVDLDGTLIKSDLLVEALCQRAGHAFAETCLQFVRHFRQPEVLKDVVFSKTTIDPATLPYHTDLVDWLRAQADSGQEIILASASPARVVCKIADHLGFFAGTLGSDRARNLKGTTKLAAIRDLIGDRPFTYVGDSRADLPLWEAADEIVTVNLSPKVQQQLAMHTGTTPGKPERALDFRQNAPRDLIQGMRPHQWVKNLLVFLPMLAAHHWTDPAIALLSALAFVAFSAAASAVYLINDLLDIEDDRHHPDKRRRPIAAGLLRADVAALIASALLLLALLMCLLAAPLLLIPLIVYITATFLYSIKIKTIAALDVIWLAGLYTMRVIAGAVATGIVTSTWLLTFCVFVFLSLACAKRCAELVTYLVAEREMSGRRGYRVSDLDIMAPIGVASGMAAVVVLMIYLQNDETRRLYARPDLLIATGVLLLYWQCRLWIKVRRDEMHSDPIVFAATDRQSQIITVLIALSLVLAAVV